MNTDRTHGFWGPKPYVCEVVGNENCSDRTGTVRSSLLDANELRIIVRQTHFRVKALAIRCRLDVRTLERRFRDHFGTTPKAWIMRERMNYALVLLTEGLTNKEVAASLSYTCESNFCRDFKRYFGSTPRKFAASNRSQVVMSQFDKRLSHYDRSVNLIGKEHRGF